MLFNSNTIIYMTFMATVIIETQTRRLSRLLKTLFVVIEDQPITVRPVAAATQEQDPFAGLSAAEYKAAFLNQGNRAVASFLAGNNGQI